MSGLDASQYDAAVVGGGPAGSVAAWELARGGAKVVILEKAALPRYKTCGGGVTRRALRDLPPGVADAVEHECCAAEVNFLDDDLRFRVHRDEPIVSMTMRADMDHRLIGLAQQAGAELFDECPVEDVECGHDGVALKTSRGVCRARFVIAADGANSFVARRLRWRDGRRLIPALEWEVTVDDDSLTRLDRAARFDFGLVPHGYAWVFPKRQHLSIGVLSMRRGAINLKAVMDRYLKLLPIKQVTGIQQHGCTIPVTPRRGPLAEGRVLLVGDAAGLVDPVTAEGITFAGRSGRMAAEALLESAFDAQTAAASYHANVRRDILPEWRAGRLLARLVYDWPRLRRALFRRHGQRLCERMMEVVVGQRNYTELLSPPLGYYKLLRLWASGFGRRDAGPVPLPAHR